MSDLLTDMIEELCPFEADTVEDMTPQQIVAHARSLHAEGIALAKRATELKSEAKSYHPAIMEWLNELGTDSMKLDGKAVSVKEVEEWNFPQEHKKEIIQWCIDNDRWEFLDVPTARFKTACKASIDAEMELPPHSAITTFNKLNGI